MPMQQTEKKLKNRIALITGAGRGIGRATAVLFTKHGADLILVSRTFSELEQTAGQCSVYGVRVLQKVLDVTDQIETDSLFEKIMAKFGRLDILINNAARFDSGMMKDYHPGDFRMMLETNVIAPFYLSQKMASIADRNKGGTIVNISSFSGCFGVEKFSGFGAYNISKYALWGLTEILSLEFKELNIRVNQLSPSGVETKMFHEAVPPGVKADLSPEQVADKILYLASDDSAPLTGANIMIQ
ncbi:MAG: SDR family oxidoreductase [Candidatus Zixiibacteriota bacterium]